MAALGNKLPGKAVMLQASGSFFAYEPILKALQTNQSMPLAEYIASSKLVSDVPKPGAAETEKTTGASLPKDLLQQGSKLFGHKEPGTLRVFSATAVCCLCLSVKRKHGEHCGMQF